MKRRSILKVAVATILICATATFAAEDAAIKGNPKSKVYHKAPCHHYAAKGSTVKFASEPEAVKAGYTPCKQCGKTEQKSAAKK